MDTEIIQETTIRLSVPIDRDINEKLANLLPRGLKAEVIRSLVELFLKSQAEYGDRWIVEDLLKGRCKLTVQNLNTTIKGD